MLMKRKFGLMLLMLMLLFGLLPIGYAQAADILVSNYSFESGLTSWTQTYGTGGITASTQQSFTGSYSAKITDTDANLQWGIESGKHSASAGIDYVAEARVYIAGGSADLYLRFWNSSHTYLTAFVAAKNTPQNGWTTIKIKGTAPANTAYVSVLLYSNKSSTGTAYWDDVQLTKEFTDLGVQVTNSAPHSAAFGIGSNANKLYAVMDGASGAVDAKLSVINLDTEQVQGSYVLNGALGGWGATTATDGKIYAGTWPSGHLYSYTPGASATVDLGQALPGQSHIRGLTAGLDGKVYGGTYPSAGFFRYYGGQGFLQLGSSPIWGSEDYVQSLDYDESANISYLGIASHAALVSFNHVTGAKSNILPAQYANEEFVFSVNVEGGKIFARLTPSNTFIVLDKSTKALDAEFHGGSIGVSPVWNNKVYYTDAGILHSYDINSKTTASTGFDTMISPCRIGLVTLADQTNYPGSTVVGIGLAGGQTWVFKYNPQNGNSKTFVVDVAEVPVSLHQVGTGPDGKIYTSGILTGGTGVYTPVRSDLYTQYDGVMQTESMIAHNGKMYFGVYPNGRFYEYDPSLPWDTRNNNPKKLFDLLAEEQSRPAAIASGGGKIFLGTIADYGKLQGALTIYDPATQTKTVKKNIVNNQSVASLAYYNGKVYGGTTIWGGLGSTPTESAAKLFVYDVAAGTTVQYTLPVSGLDAVTSVVLGSDNKIWGMAEGYLFVFNPATNQFEYFANKFTDVVYNSSVWHDATLLTTRNGQLFGTIKNKYLFRINMSDKTIITLLNTGANRLAEDEFGNLYYLSGTHMWRYTN